MATTEDHLRYLEGGVIVLEDYVLSSEMFWAIGVPAAEKGNELPRLTMGGLLLTWERLKASKKSEGEKKRFDKVNSQIEAIRSHWRVAWGRKCQLSFHTRLNMWRNFLDEYRIEPSEHADRYAYEVRGRVMLHLLQRDAQLIENTELGLLAKLDSLLRHVLQPGPFLWEAEQAEGFPPEEYWFLYGYLPKEIN